MKISLHFRFGLPTSDLNPYLADGHVVGTRPKPLPRLGSWGKNVGPIRPGADPGTTGTQPDQQKDSVTRSVANFSVTMKKYLFRTVFKNLYESDEETLVAD